MAETQVIDKAPSGLVPKTQQAEQQLADAGVLRAYQLRPRHWAVLHLFAAQEPVAWDLSDDRSPRRLQLNTEGLPDASLKDLARLGLIHKFSRRHPDNHRRVLYHTWLVSPRMLHTIRAAIRILTEANAGTCLFQEPLSAHTYRLWRPEDEIGLLRRELARLLQETPDINRVERITELIDVLSVRKQSHWYGTVFVPANRSAVHNTHDTSI